MRDNVLIDLRNVYRTEEVVRKGFRYVSVGRPQTDVETMSDAPIAPIGV